MDAIASTEVNFIYPLIMNESLWMKPTKYGCLKESELFF
jgi:hypothetical protein